MTRYQYENLLREPVEYWSAAVYGVGTTALIMLPEIFLMPKSIAWGGAAVLAARGLWRFRFARRLTRYQKQLTSLASFTRSSSEVGHSKKVLWIGKGFLWDASHTQRMYDLDEAKNKRFLQLPVAYRFARYLEVRYE